MPASPEFVEKLFSQLAPVYEKVSVAISGGMILHWYDLLFKTLDRIYRIKSRDGKRIEHLDIATGTGLIPLWIWKHWRNKVSVTGIDLTEGMLKIARHRMPDWKFIVGDALNLPFDDNSFDVATVTFGLRNMEDPAKAISEAYRVLRSGGYFLVLEVVPYPNPLLQRLFEMHVGTVSAIAGGILSGNITPYVYFAGSVDSFFTREGFEKACRNAGFRKVGILPMAFGGSILAICQK
ncbi:MAG: ubiquinone/menaquinone biosynthesis methyltransferase [Chlorobi bacterium]|nr:ubiquinone/menaquinone biosynthesis methyltransferase [Chlorobiota bacterium]